MSQARQMLGVGQVFLVLSVVMERSWVPLSWSELHRPMPAMMRGKTCFLGIVTSIQETGAQDWRVV